MTKQVGNKLQTIQKKMHSNLEILKLSKSKRANTAIRAQNKRNTREMNDETIQTKQRQIN